MLTLIILLCIIEKVMRFESKLCHLSENKAVVLVNGWLDDRNLGSALAEGSTVELAEDKAISRLKTRINIIDNKETNTNPNKEKSNQDQLNVGSAGSQEIETINIKEEPDDWSNELTAIESEIKRLDWSRDDEIKFLEKKFGYHNRNCITKYNELVYYLSILRKIDNYNSSKLNSNNIENMIKESDIILNDLSWDKKQGREYLIKEFNVSTRKELNEKQLISFVSKLKSIRNKYLS
tara:strand:+ start:81 stop:788 length:708 start_codon:yes stop_codon:yes gene_type:complete